MGIWTEGEETGGKWGMKLPSQGAHTQGEPCVKVESVGRKVALNKNKGTGNCFKLVLDNCFLECVYSIRRFKITPRIESHVYES